ncbi:DUF4037 domain-containing protein [Bifidobacterium stellenboschense]|uniref:Tetratricopeptide repeat-containing protein n=1 Tax=Bifidobacterium stellenboschense TaxID=762211 RepID=A0A087DR34_9BIFI|nr:DUF4037 domain-containing protein [Bifidobacterium stellenboschense]KFI97984.1 Tetratricopeptide repeat-containing protein [Bifidobacterium stellenboschense]
MADDAVDADALGGMESFAGDSAMDSELEAALERMAAKHAHDFGAPQYENADATGAADTTHVPTTHAPTGVAAATYAAATDGDASTTDSDASTTAGDTSDAADDAAPTFDVNGFLTGLDAIFAAHDAAEKAGPYLEQAAVDAENAGDEAGLLTVLNETMGFYRSQGRHEENQWIVQRAIELALHMGLEGTEAWATTLINCATAMRAAKHYDQSEDLYRQALACAERNYEPTDRRLAALHNNLSMLYSETDRIDKAEAELREALRIIESSSVNPDADIDVASSHTNLALVLLQEGKLEGADWHAAKALEIYADGHLEHSAHYASALAGLAQVRYAEHRYADAVAYYRRALAVIEECYGTDTDYYRITEANLREAEAEVGAGDASLPPASGRWREAPEGGQQTGIRTADADHPQSAPRTAPASGSGNTTSSPLPPASGSRDAASSPLPPASGSGDVTDASLPPAGGRWREAPESGHAAPISGLKLAKAYWEEIGRPMVRAKYPEYADRIAAGLVGHGSECYGFDDAYSHDHDFGPRFCLWLTDDDYAAIGARLQADYDALPRDFRGYVCPSATADEPTDTASATTASTYIDTPTPSDTGATNTTNTSATPANPSNPTALSPLTPRAQGAFRRDGVFRIGDFFESITGYRKAPAADAPHEWLMLDEATLAAATNGQVFADPLGAFSETRQGFKDMPEDVRLALVSKRLGMIAQAGQYNLPRSLKRGDGAAAWLAIAEFVDAAASLVFLVNKPMVAGYLPYYKWRFAALRKLSGGMFARLGDVCGKLESVMRLASAACYGGAGFGEGGKGSAPAAETIERLVEEVAASIVKELKRDGFTRSDETFLEWQRPYVEEHIASDAACLHSL